MPWPWRTERRLDAAVNEIRQAVALYEQLLAEGHGEVRAELGKTRGNLGGILHAQGHKEEAAAELRRTATLFEQLVRAGRDDLRPELAKAQTNLRIILQGK